jgi:hypothetical protein
MLYVIYCANHPGLAYQGGQEPIIHLVADLHAVTGWAEENGVRWAFSLSNAGAYYAEFRACVEHLDQLDWAAIAAREWAALKEPKQAEFLVHERFPFELVERIGVKSGSIRVRTRAALGALGRQPPVEIRPDWYY